MSSHRIAVLSDTHSLLRPEIKEILRGCEVILHAGDIMSQKTANELRAIAPTYFVRGNADKEWAEELPRDRILDLYSLRIYMIHNKKEILDDVLKDGNMDVILYGHSHKYEEIRKGSTLFFNPGSCGPRRFHQPITMAVMTVEDGGRQNEKKQEGSVKFSIEKIEITPPPPVSKKTSDPSQDPVKVIKVILRDMRANRPVSEIARRNHLKEELVNQILQIYTTHPGIDLDGILNRLPEDWMSID